MGPTEQSSWECTICINARKGSQSQAEEMARLAAACDDYQTRLSMPASSLIEPDLTPITGLHHCSAYIVPYTTSTRDSTTIVRTDASRIAVTVSNGSDKHSSPQPETTRSLMSPGNGTSSGTVSGFAFCRFARVRRCLANGHVLHRVALTRCRFARVLHRVALTRCLFARVRRRLALARACRSSYITDFFKSICSLFNLSFCFKDHSCSKFLKKRCFKTSEA
ncbi:hypothetical protein J6590_011195 [Homalodisca vitripennis]|nr:hypothetical protein J6590_011195 [Homalodisca vitripennis]